MRRALISTPAAITAALAIAILSGCGGDESPKKKAPKSPAPNSARSTCAGHECKVRIRCNGRLYVYRGSAPVDIRTSQSLLRRTIVADFAGSQDDAVVRC